MNNCFAESSVGYIISGYGSSTSKELYQKVGEAYKNHGIDPVYVEIDWSSNDINDYLAQAESYIESNGGDNRFFYGFSMGGLIALVLPQSPEVKHIIVSSVTPFFRENIDPLPWYSLQKIYYWWLFGDSKSVSLSKAVSDLNFNNSKVTLLVGSREKDIVLTNTKTIARLLDDSNMQIIDNAGHGISEPGHLDVIIKSISK